MSCKTLETQEADGGQDQGLNDGTIESGGQVSPQAPPFTAGRTIPPFPKGSIQQKTIIKVGGRAKGWDLVRSTAEG